MNLKAILVVLPIILVLRAQAQNADTISPATELKKNMIYMTVGFAGLYAVVNGNYERVIAYNEKTFFKYYLVRVGGGYWGAWGGEGTQAVAGFTTLSGSRKSHLELHLGVAYIFDKYSYDNDVSYSSGSEKPKRSDYTNISPAGAVGYRYQKPGGHFVLRTGVAFPESFYVSVGFCF